MDKRRKAAPPAVVRVIRALTQTWRRGSVRSMLRRNTKLSDEQLEEVLASPEFRAALERMWRVILGEVSLGLLVSLVARTEKETPVARLLVDLTGLAVPPAAPATPADPEPDFTALEQAILENLRAAVQAPADGGSDGLAGSAV